MFAPLVLQHATFSTTRMARDKVGDLVIQACHTTCKTAVFRRLPYVVVAPCDLVVWWDQHTQLLFYSLKGSSKGTKVAMLGKSCKELLYQLWCPAVFLHFRGCSSTQSVSPG